MDAGLLSLLMQRQHIFNGHWQVIQQHRAAGSGALAKPRPVVDDSQAGRAALDEYQHNAALFIKRFYWHPMGKQGTGRIEFLAAQAIAVGCLQQARFHLQYIPGAAFRTGVANPLAGQDIGVDASFLRSVGALCDHAENAKMVLRDLSQGRIGRAQYAEYFGQRAVGNLGAAKCFWNADPTQAAGREFFNFRPRQMPFAVTFTGAGTEFGR